MLLDDKYASRVISDDAPHLKVVEIMWARVLARTEERDRVL
jgi:hypothetical protein